MGLAPSLGNGWVRFQPARSRKVGQISTGVDTLDFLKLAGIKIVIISSRLSNMDLSVPPTEITQHRPATEPGADLKSLRAWFAVGGPRGSGFDGILLERERIKRHTIQHRRLMNHHNAA